MKSCLGKDSLMTRLVLLSLLVLSALTIVFSQQAANATLTGAITDAMGAVIADAKITATQIATGIKRDTVSNEAGVYVLSNMTPGDYELRIEVPGFATKVTKPVTLNVGQAVTFSTRLEVDTTHAVVEKITSQLPLIDNNNSLIDGIIASREVESLPLNGRNFLELALLIPGNAPAPNFDPTKTNTVVISSAGQLGRGGNITIDGVDTNDDVVGGSIQNISQEAIQEFQIATNRFSS